MIGKSGMFCRRNLSTDTQYFLIGGGATAVAVIGSRVFSSGVPLTAIIGAAPALAGVGGATSLDDITADGGNYSGSRSAQVWVSGAGLSGVEGLYLPNQTFNDRTAYSNSETGTSILWRGTEWYLSAVSVGAVGDAYKLGSGTNPGAAELLYPDGLPPLGEALYPPAPSVVYLPPQTDPDLHGGRIVLSYPSSIPALTVSAGLTYTETSVGSNRQYVFTAGSGTITFP